MWHSQYDTRCFLRLDEDDYLRSMIYNHKAAKPKTTRLKQRTSQNHENSI